MQKLFYIYAFNATNRCYSCYTVTIASLNDIMDYTNKFGYETTICISNAFPYF